VGIPDDLIDLQRRFFTADAECERIAATLPRSTDIAAGRAEISPEQRAELEQARAERLRLVQEIYRHHWWSMVPNAHEARMAVRAAARKAEGPPPP
jgi:hypothetical protein